MKKLLFTLLAVATLVSCTMDNDIDVDSSLGGAVSFTISDDDLTRAQSSAKESWTYGDSSTGDKLAIFDSSSNMYCYYVASVSGSTYTLLPYDTSSQFKILSASETYTAYYPYKEDYSLENYKDQTLDEDVLTSTATLSETKAEFSTFTHANCYLTFNFYPGCEFTDFTQIDLYLKDISYKTVWSVSLTSLGNASSYTYSLYYPATSLSGLKLYMVANGNAVASSVLDLAAITNYTLWVGGTPYNYDRVVIGSSDIIYNGSTYEIYTAAGLAAFRDMVNGTASESASVVYNGGAANFDFATTEVKASINGKLMNDIDLGGIDGAGVGITGKEWTPIGNYSSDPKVYSGTFDGNGYEVSGLYINDSSSSYQGLFGFASSATIKNLGVSGKVSGVGYVGGVVGYSTSTITSCYNMADVSGTSDYVGGVVGYNSSYISSCYNTGDVSGKNNVGGVAGYNASNITYCYNTGDVSGTSDDVGGIAGYNTSYITNCYNLAAVTGSVTVGGIAGENTSSSYVVNCYNQGDVTGNDITTTYLGGLVGYNAGTVKVGYNTGAITGGTGTNYIGGAVGYSTSNDISGCYCLEDTTYSIGVLYVNSNTTNVLTNRSSSDTLKALTSTLNSAAGSYNDGTPAVNACAWEEITDGYPVLDFDGVPTSND